MNRVLSFAAVLLAFAGTVHAQTALGTGTGTAPAPAADVSNHEDTYGTLSPTAEVVGAYECDPFDPATPINPSPGSPNRFTTGFMECPLTVPAGATITSIELEACDTTATGDVTMGLLNTTTPAGGGNGIVSVTTGFAATPGCTRVSVAVPAGTPNVNNAAQKWWFEVRTSGPAGQTSFAAGRALYRLNVSPAPATATFSDVPVGHPQLRFVEALVAAGITGGCGGGNYCPDSAVTRGQMAVFLASALGLHFTP